VSLTEYADALFDRYANPGIRHRIWQIAMDGSQKLPQRILGSLAANLSAGRDCPALCLAVAAWMRYVGGMDEQGQEIDVRDPLAARLRDASDSADTPEGKVAALLGMREVFPADLADQLKQPVTAAAIHLWAKGARAAIQEGTL